MFGVTYEVITQSHGMKMKQENQKISSLTKVLWAEKQPSS